MEIISDHGFIISLLALCRILPIIIFIPGANHIPITVKLLLSIALSISISPTLIHHWQNINFFTYVQEGCIGIFIGLSINIIFQALSVASAIMAAQSGLSSAVFFDPLNSTQDNVLTKFFSYTIITLMFATDTHFFILSGIANSYKLFTIDTEIGNYSTFIVHIISASFALAIKFALPVLVVCTLTYFAAGIIGKLIPYVQVYFIVMPLQIYIGMLIIFFSLSGALLWFMDNYNTLIRDFLLK